MQTPEGGTAALPEASFPLTQATTDKKRKM
jgi:hypothetical protein